MSEINIIERRLVPVKPKVIANEQVEIYVPVAGYEYPGVAAYNSDDFVVTGGIVHLKYDDSYYMLHINSLNNELYGENGTSAEPGDGSIKKRLTTAETTNAKQTQDILHNFASISNIQNNVTILDAIRITKGVELSVDDTYNFTVSLKNSLGNEIATDTVDLKLKDVLTANSAMIAQNASDIQGLRNDFKNEEHFRGWVTKDSEFETLKGDANDFAYSAESGTVWIYNNDAWQNSGEKVPGDGGSGVASDETPLMDGTASAGASNAYARGDHRHPSDVNKLDKQAGLTTYPQVYAKYAGGGQGMYNISDVVANGAIPLRRPDGNIFVPTNTESVNSAISKYQADNSYVAKMAGTPDTGATRGFLYGLTYDGTTPNLYKVQIQANADTIPLRNPNGTFYVGTPTIQYEAANKGYVDDNFVAKNTATTSYSQVYAKAPNGSQTQYNVSTDVVNSAIAQRRIDGTILVPTTTEYQNAAISKHQADNSYVAKSTTTVNSYVYGYDPNGQRTTQYTPANILYSLVQRRDGNTFDCGTPTSPEHVTNKGYVDDNFVAQITDETGFNKAYGFTARGAQTQFIIDSTLSGAQINRIPQRGTNGLIYIPTASITEDECAVNKKYVDDNFLAKKTGIVSEVIITQKPDGTTDNLVFSDTSMDGYYMVRRTVNGDVLVPSTPVSGYGAINKIYVAPTLCSVTLNDGDIEETYTVTIPAFMKQTPSAYVGACCDDDENHVIVGYSHAMDAFIVTDLTDDAHTSISNYTINQ